jgi:CTP:molybdopterin cytidylyltransferase MocA
MTDVAPPALRFGAIILAAGASTRMGSPKQLLLLDGQPLVVRAATGARVEIQRQALWRAHPLVRDAHEHPVCVGKADH